MKNKKSDLQKIRRSIDLIDAQLVRLLNERAKNVLKVKKVKTEAKIHFYAPHRESEVYRRVAQLNKGPFGTKALEAIFCEIMSASLALETPLKIVYGGGDPALAGRAAVRKFGVSSEYIPCSSIGDVLGEVERGEAHYGVVPIENSLGGKVFLTPDLLSQSNLSVCSEILLPISHTLLSRSGELRKIKRVYGNLDFLGFSWASLEEHLSGVKVIETPSAQEALRRARKDPDAAAIGLTQRAHDSLKRIALRLDGTRHSFARFWVIGHTNAQRTGKDKTSMVISTQDKLDALLIFLRIFKKEGVSLTSIASWPSTQKAGNYHWLIDFHGHREDLKTRRIMNVMEGFFSPLRVLGSYPHCEL